MKIPYLLATLCVLPLLAMSISAHAELIASDDIYTESNGQSPDQIFAASSISATGITLTPDVLADFKETQPYPNLGNFIDKSAPARQETDSFLNLWVLLIAGAVLGILSEVFHRMSSRR
jgi:hypothetical protein